jgi:hypothetical protein
MAYWLSLAPVFVIGFVAGIAVALKGISDLKFSSSQEFADWIRRRD